MDFTGNGIQNWFLKEIELLVYYVKRPLRGLLQEIPRNHLFSSWIENTCLCIAYGKAFTVQTISLYILYLELYSLFFQTPCKKSRIFPICLDHAEIWQHEILCKPTILGAMIFSSNTNLGNRNLRCPTSQDYLGTVDHGSQVILSFHRNPKITEWFGTVNYGAQPLKITWAPQITAPK